MIASEKTPFLFIDLDGTLREAIEGQFINTAENQKLMDGVADTLRRYAKAGFQIAVVTNQGGVAAGYKTIHSWMNEWSRFIDLLKQENAGVHFMRACYHHPTDGIVKPFDNDSQFRKPNGGMVSSIEVEAHNHGIVIDWKNSLMVGDRPEDEGLANTCGLRFMSAKDWRNPHPILVVV